MFVTVHVGMCVFADDPGSTDLGIVKKRMRLPERKSVKTQAQSRCSVFVCVLDCAMNENEEAENRIL